MQTHNKHIAAFTLVELSIVLVIIGLLAGGILAGRDMIESAKIRKIISEVDKINTAINTFKGKYNCLPGDCQNATTFFGTRTPCSASNPAELNTPYPQTCNGNNNDSIDGQPLTSGAMEAYTVWQHLSYAELIPNKYTGLVTATGISSGSPQYWPRWMTANINTPTTAFSGRSTYCMVENDIIIGNGSYNANPRTCDEPVLTPLQAFQIDSKTDDGLPLSGKTFADEGNYAYGGTLFGSAVEADCIDSAANHYSANNNTIGCILSFTTKE